MKTLFPEIRPYQTQMLDVGDGHTIYLECSGTQSGIPVLVLHGGPGAGSSAQLRRFFDPQRYHIIVFDQRGAGRSKPHASTHHNTTQHLLSDMERIRQHLTIDRWALFGGSFGALLALLYAEKHPERVLGLILRGIYLGRPQDLDWLYREGASRFFPNEWDEFTEQANGKTGLDLIENYSVRLRGQDELAMLSAAKAWARWEAVNSSFRPNQDTQNYFTGTHNALALARISTHYFRHHNFIEAGQVIRDIDKIQHLPGYIVHGRYDMVCPPDQAWTLSKCWPNGELNLIREAGHSAFDGAMMDALIRSTAKLASRLGSVDNEA